MGKLTKLVGVAGAVAGVTYLSKSEKVKGQFDKAIEKFNSSYMKNLGKPSNIDDAKMVDEGAMTSVQYYNEQQEKSQGES
ncbi:hypothetical protein [Oceanobacillus polygoni]|uniref:Uncharacterized protein n=1 Tax=Oceanobacillus polygoni TaxID=1235259 RepID=A0A9X1CKJ0_9BACI|nr:hypothetical protein [Oceanobacillus polygoni]MBP2079603.1 hypothetical protein [Oceanobacillus polygoni]